MMKNGKDILEKYMNFERKKYYNTIVVDDNSIELHNKLIELGYTPLRWTTSSGRKNLRTVLTNYYPYDKEYKLSFWNDGTSIEDFVCGNRGDIMVCNTAEEFIEKSIYLLSNNEIIIKDE